MVRMSTCIPSAKHRLVPGPGPREGEQPCAEGGGARSRAAQHRQGSSGTWVVHGKCGPRRGQLLPPPLHQDIPGPPDTASGDSEGKVPVHSEG